MSLRRAAGGLSLITVLAALTLAGPASAAVTLPAGFQRTTILGNLSRPTAVAWTPDGRMLIAMRDGPLKVLKTDGTVVTPYSVSTNTYGDHGFLGVAVDANYTSNHCPTGSPRGSRCRPLRRAIGWPLTAPRAMRWALGTEGVT